MFKLVEKPDLAKLKQVIESGRINETKVNEYNHYYKEVVNGKGSVERTYYQKPYNGNYHGRYYCNQMSSQRMDRYVRSAVFSATEFDIDIVSCHLSILNNICNANGIKVCNLRKYLEDKESIFKTMDFTDAEIKNYNYTNKQNWSFNDFCKFVVTSSLYGASLPTIKKTLCLKRSAYVSDSMQKLLDELRKLRSKIVELPTYVSLIKDMNEHFTAKYAKTQNPTDQYNKGKGLSFILQKHETEHVMNAIKMCQTEGLEVSSYIYDGFQIRSSSSEKVHDIVKKINEKMPVKFVIKEFPKSILDFEPEMFLVGDTPNSKIPQTEFFTYAAFNSISIKDSFGKATEEELLIKKQYFEQHCAFVEKLNRYFFRIGSKEWLPKTRTQLLENNGYMKDFLKYWLDSDKRTVQTICWCPYSVVSPPKEYQTDETRINVFGGLLHEIQPDFIVSEEKISLICDHLRIVWADNVPRVYEHIINCFASIIQKPWEKLGISILLKSSREGAGKNIILEFIADHVLGRDFSRSFSDIDSFLSKFNADAERSIITILDEIGGNGATIKNSNRLKDIITRKSVPIEKKGLDRYLAKDCNNCFMTTNDDWIVKLSVSDRRNFCLELNNEKINEKGYFAKLAEACESREVGLHFFHYLMQINLTEFVANDIPSTEWREELRERTTKFDPMFRTLLSLRGETRLSSKDLLDRHNKFANKHNICSSTKAMNKKWVNYTRWPKQKPRIDGEQVLGFIFTDELILQTCRDITRNPTYEFPEIFDESINCQL